MTPVSIGATCLAVVCFHGQTRVLSSFDPDGTNVKYFLLSEVGITFEIEMILKS